MGCESKVYLSKSNLADKDHIQSVRDHLLSLGYEIVEWQPHETYTEHPMLECDQMVMVGYDMNSDDIMEVGKGQFNQLEFREGNGLQANCYLVGFDGGDGTPEYYSCELSIMLDANAWKKGYGEVQLIDDYYFNECEAPVQKKAKLDPTTERQVNHMEVELQEQLQQPIIHLACITLFK